MAKKPVKKDKPETDPMPDNKIGYGPINSKRWEQAQIAEQEAHKNDPNNTAQHYAETYKKYFSYLGLGTNLDGLHIIEIGPAQHSALAICSNYGRSVVIEPMLTQQLLEFTRDNGIIYIDEPLENLEDEKLQELRDALPGTKEVWLFNVMQHIIDPDIFIAKCKIIADRIRFFEPINYPTSEHHPHSYTINDFISWFGADVVKMYNGTESGGFHQSACAYGVCIK
jgi:hypothetical protein